MDAKQAIKIATAAVEAYEPMAPCELCCEDSNVCDWSDVRHYCAAGVAKMLRGLAGDPVAANKSNRRGKASKAAIPTEQPTDNDLRGSDTQVSSNTARKYAYVADMTARAIKRHPDSFLKLIDDLEAPAVARSVYKQRATIDEFITQNIRIESEEYVKRNACWSIIRAYIARVRPDLSKSFFPPSVYKTERWNSLLDDEAVATLEKHLQYKRESVFQR